MVVCVGFCLFYIACMLPCFKSWFDDFVFVCTPSSIDFRLYCSFSQSANTRQVFHLEVSPKYFTVATVVLFSASEQTLCVVVVCNSELVTVVLHNMFGIATEVLFSCYMGGAT